jgi:hypothetical protein
MPTAVSTAGSAAGVETEAAPVRGRVVKSKSRAIC